ncbi:iron-sulfur cluster assembly accessory protein [Candidatus Sumerlaeota bacterium]|nr:iron-sulfur cluster assembly accessory protein [Candidatus Sumerlaeota bacterium]
MSIDLSPAAIQEVHCLMKAESKEGCGLRVGVKGGGCSGLSYTMQFDEKPGEHDRVQEVDGVKLYIDPKSYLYLNGMLLDYTTELIGGGFKFVNPNATKTCACGTSFSV